MLKVTSSLLFALTVNVSCAVSDPFPEVLDPVVGDYRGQRTHSDGSTEPVFAQVIQRKGAYQARILSTLDERVEPEVILRGEGEEDSIRFPQALGRGNQDVIRSTPQGVLVAASLWDGALKQDGSSFEGSFTGFWNGRFEMEPMHRERYQGATLGAPAPEGAVVLFSGDSTEGWKNPQGDPISWQVVEGNLQVMGKGDAISEEVFGDHHIHLEFRSPYMDEEGQKRGNSGVYLHGRYEVQILDSHGLSGETNECGGIYQIAKPRVNMCAPATVWQSYDIDFTAPRFDEDGKKTANARVTVRHNGVVIHDDLELPHVTGGALGQGNEVSEGPLRLQNHNDPVQFRNVWVLRK